MKKLIPRLISLVLALTIFVSMGGFMVYMHHCQHHGQSFTSYFMPVNHHEMNLPCEPVVAETCCQKGEMSGHQHCDGECCHDTELYLKITPDTEPAKKIYHKIILPAEEFTYIDRHLQDESTNLPVSIQGWDDPPPEVKPPGRALVLIHHQFKLGTL